MYLPNDFSDDQAGRPLDAVKHSTGDITDRIHGFNGVFPQLPDAVTDVVCRFGVEKSRHVFLCCRDVDNVLKEFEMGCLETLEVGRDTDLFEIHRTFVQDPGSGKIEILESATGEFHLLFGLRNNLVEGFLEDFQIFEYPVILQENL